MDNLKLIERLSLVLLSCVIMLGNTSRASGQGYDTVRVMTYNVLNYPGNTSAIRNPEFRKVFGYVNPDVVVVQEMLSSAGSSDFLANTLNSGQPGTYGAAPFLDGPDTDNAMYYKLSRFTFVDQTVLHTELRDINGYRLRPVGIGADTLDLRIYSVHFKASQGYEAARFAEADTLRNHLNGLPDGLFLIAAGDMNLYTSNEPAYQELTGSQTDNSGRLYDPIDTPGSWSNNPAFAAVHTQSTRTGSIGDGGATGGLDDRFDFLLPSFAFQSTNRWQYVSGTYTEFGNDGNHFNLSINDGANGAVPDTIANALYLASDHLPVFMDICRPVVVAPSIAILVPNGGENWYAGYTQNIAWTSQNLTGTVSLRVNRNYPSGTWENVITGTLNDGTHPWVVTLPASYNARFMVVSDVQPAVNDLSDASFSVSMPVVSLMVPNGSEHWLIGQNATILWSSVGVTGGIRVELNRSFPGGEWETLYANTSDDGNENWSVTGPSTAHARMRVLSLTNGLAGDTSAANFSIALPWSPPLIVHDPRGDAAEGPVTFVARVIDNMPGAITTLHWQRSGAVWDSILMNPTGYTNELSATLWLGFGRHSYCIRSTDVELQSSATDTLDFVVSGTCGLRLGYDDGAAESYNWSEHHEYMWAVRFSPAQTPFVLCGTEIAVAGFHPDSSHDQIRVRVLAADGAADMPGTILRDLVRGTIGNVVGGLTGGQQHQAFVALYDDALAPLTFTGDFYVAVGNVPGGTEAFGLDTSGVNQGRSVIWDPCEELWLPESEIHPSTRRGNRIIRVIGWTDAPSQLVIQRVGADARLVWTSADAPYYHVDKSLTADGAFGDRIGTSSDTSFVIPAAFQSDVRSFFRVQASATP